MYVSLTYKWYQFCLCVTLKQYPEYEVYTSNTIQDIRQSHLIMKYSSSWPMTNICNEVNTFDTWNQYPKYQVDSLNGLQDISQYHWPIEYTYQSRLRYGLMVISLIVDEIGQCRGEPLCGVWWFYPLSLRRWQELT